LIREAPGAEQGPRQALEVPPWCEVEPGAGPLLLVAPHGGRRPVYDAGGPPLRRRVNDLYTPELTRWLATALGAGRIINHGLDRNAIDLNRLSDVHRHAPSATGSCGRSSRCLAQRRRAGRRLGPVRIRARRKQRRGHQPRDGSSAVKLPWMAVSPF